MNKFLISTFALLMSASSAFAADFFFKSDVPSSPYFVMGMKGEGTKNPICVANADWPDGSSIQFIKDLADGEFYIWFQNNQWNISDPANTKSELRANFIQSNGRTTGLNFEILILNKNTIVIPSIMTDKFLPLFSAANKLQFIMPGTISNAQVSLVGSTRALIELSNCVDASRQVDLRIPSKKPEINL